MSAQKRVGLLGGGFNPPHNGHVGICEMVFQENWVEEVWVIPCWDHPFNKSLAPFEHRFEMCRLAFEKFGERVRVLEVEKKLGGKSFTLRTVQHLKKENPDEALMLILGEDAAKEAPQWNQYRELKEAIEWLVVRRGPHSKISDVHATSIRQAIADGKGWEEEMPKKVVEYIRRHGLYKEG